MLRPALAQIVTRNTTVTGNLCVRSLMDLYAKAGTTLPALEKLWVSSDLPKGRYGPPHVYFNPPDRHDHDSIWQLAFNGEVDSARRGTDVIEWWFSLVEIVRAMRPKGLEPKSGAISALADGCAPLLACLFDNMILVSDPHLVIPTVNGLLVYPVSLPPAALPVVEPVENG